jgi:hypothetical protein
VRPNLTGRAFETTFVRALLSFARQRFVAEGYRATCAASDRRAIRLLGQWADFKVAGQFAADRNGVAQQYVVLTLTERPPDHAFGPN